jgi:Tfp pilus assembly protein PilE
LKVEAFMKTRVIISTVLALLLGIAAPAYAQSHQQQDDKQQREHSQQQVQSKQDQHTQKQDRSKQQQQHAQQPDRNKQQEQHVQQQDRNRQQQSNVQRRQPVQRGQERQVWQQHRAHNWQSQHRDWQQRGGYNGYRIPDNRYRAHFGRNHWFRIHRYPMELYRGYPRFQYGGFWFGFMDPWPEYWDNNWYENDDVYIVFSDGGYYLYNRRYPRDRITISVYLH